MNIQTTPLPKRTYYTTLLLLGLLVAGGLWLVVNLFQNGFYPLGIMISAVLVFLGAVYARPHFSPFRWLAISMGLAMLFTLYPIFYTLFIAFTNMGDGHLIPKEQLVTRLEERRYLPEDGNSYAWAAYANDAQAYQLWLVADDGQTFIADAEGNFTQSSAENFPQDEDGFPTQLSDDFQRLPRRNVVQQINELGAIDFGSADRTIRIRSLQDAATLLPQYVYDAEQDIIVDQETGGIFRPIDGAFVNDAGEELVPGYMTAVGTENFVRFLSNKALREPLLSMLIWTFTFAFLSVALSFIVGLVIALIFEDLPGKRIVRGLLIIPYPIPVIIAVMIWRALLNPDLGFLHTLLESVLGSAAPNWFLEPFWTKVGLILVNIWLSYPYFFVVTAGALSSIPAEVSQAATVDGASAWQKLRHITLPLLLRVVSPLLIASFTFNFNNFNLIYIFNYGNPPVANTLIPVGHTDILISFVYKLAFVSSGATSYGLAAAISIVLFILVGGITLLQTRLTGALQEA